MWREGTGLAIANHLVARRIPNIRPLMILGLQRVSRHPHGVSGVQLMGCKLGDMCFQSSEGTNCKIYFGH